MIREYLEWLPLSNPGSTDTTTKVELSEVCPYCNWPVPANANICAHCKQPLNVTEHNKELPLINVELPPPDIKIERRPPLWFNDSILDTPQMYNLRLQAERLKVTGGFDRLICLDNISIDHYQYQLEVALRVLRDMGGRALLADEVGLGKTIEAGIVMKELIERGLAGRILIITPASLTWQWYEEMKTKFHEEFVVLESLSQLPELSAHAEIPEPQITCRWIVSISRAKNTRWAQRLLLHEYDLLIIDEAHKLKNHRTQSYKFVNQIRKRYILMLTATPVHNDLGELYNLITILRPGHLGTRIAFENSFMYASSGGKRRVLIWYIKDVYGISGHLKSAKNVRNAKYTTNTDITTSTSYGELFSFDELPKLPLITETRVPKITQQDISQYAEIQSEFEKLIQQGYQVDQAWIVQGKSHKVWANTISNKLCGLRIELSRARGKVVKDKIRPKRLPARRTIYSKYGKFTIGKVVYLRMNRQARELFRQDKEKSQRILKVFDDISILKQPALLNQEHKAIQEIEQLIKKGYEVTDFEAVEWDQYWDKPRWRKENRIDFVCRLKLNPEARKLVPNESQSLSQRRTKVRNPAALRGLLREVMIRNRRTTVGVRFPPREAAVYHLNLTQSERALYDGVTTYIREQFKASNNQTPQKKRSRGALKLTLLTLQKQLCSSPQAVAQGLKKLYARQPDPRLEAYLALAKSIEQSRKVMATKTILSQYPGKFLVFTDYLPTMHALNTALTKAGHETVLFHGGLNSIERIETVRQFRQSARVMISTRSGGEGHNLQFCHQLINYDLPWNPMRIEQRIGRIHRLGQKNRVRIFNLSATNTIEAYILDLLAHKIRMFELVIGELDLILGQLDEQQSFEDYIHTAWAGSQSEADLLAKISQLEEIIEQTQVTYERIRAMSDELSLLLE